MIHAAIAFSLAIFIVFDSAAQPLPRKGGQREEVVEGVEIRYGEVRTDKGYRVRTYTSRPRGASGRLPLSVFIPWLSCDAVENPRDMKDGWSFMLRQVMRDAGMQLVRVEKPGVGDRGASRVEGDLAGRAGAPVRAPHALLPAAPGARRGGRVAAGFGARAHRVGRARLDHGARRARARGRHPARARPRARHARGASRHGPPLLRI